MCALRSDIGIDLGTASVLVYVKGKGIVINEPSVVAIDQYTKNFLAVGEDAKKMLGRTPGNIVAIRPLRDGVISDYHITERMLKYFIKKAIGNSLFRPRLVICVPSGVTEVEKKAVIDASINAGAMSTQLIEEPISAAIGAGIDITEPSGNMVVDIGGGTTDVAVISLGGIVVSNSIKTAGDECNDAISRYIKKKYNMMIGDVTAENIKIDVGCAHPLEQPLVTEIRGRNLLTGLPRTVTVSSDDVMEALKETIEEIMETIHGVLERTPPELSSDIAEKGIYLTGGGAMLRGLDKLISIRTGINAIIADDPVSCVAKGTGKSLEFLKTLEKVNS